MAGTTIIPNQPQPTPTQNVAPPPTPAPAPAPAAPNPAIQGLAHDAAFGRAAKMLMGSATNYTINPQTGQTVATPVQNTPGSFFRNVLNAALLGGAAAEQAHAQNPQMGFAGGLVTGGAGQINAAQKQDQLKRDQAQQQFQNQQAAAQQQREQAESESRLTYQKALTAQTNLSTLRLHQEIQGGDFDLHDKVAAAGRAEATPYEAAHIAPAVTDLPESQMTQYLHDHPGASGNVKWFHTGVKMGVGPDGQPTFESTMTAYPTGPVEMTKAVLDQWKKDGVMDRYPEYATLKPGQKLDTDQYLALTQRATAVRADNIARQNDNLDLQEKQARVNASNATAAHEIAETRKANIEAHNDVLGQKQSELFGQALDNLDKVNGDFSKIKPSARILIAESTSKMSQGLADQYRQVVANVEDPGSQAKAQELFGQMETLNSLGARAMQGIVPKAAPAATPNFVGADGTKYNIPPDEIAAFKAAHPDAKPFGATTAPPATPGGPTTTVQQDLESAFHARGAVPSFSASKEEP